MLKKGVDGSVSKQKKAMAAGERKESVGGAIGVATKAPPVSVIVHHEQSKGNLIANHRLAVYVKGSVSGPLLLLMPDSYSIRASSWNSVEHQ